METVEKKRNYRTRCNILPEYDSQFISLYFNREHPMSLGEISLYYRSKGIKISRQAISDHIKNQKNPATNQNYVLRIGREAHSKGRNPPSYEEVREKYVDKEKSAAEISKGRCGIGFIYKMLDEMGIKRRGIGRKRINFPKEEKKEMIEMHRERKSCYKIADYLAEKGYKACHATVWNRLIEWGEIKLKESGLEEKVK